MSNEMFIVCASCVRPAGFGLGVFVRVGAAQIASRSAQMRFFNL